MRIALVSREYPPFFGGGIGTFAHAGAQALVSIGHEVRVITQQGQDRRDAIETSDGMHVHRIGLEDAGSTWGRRFLAFSMRAGGLVARWHDDGEIDVAEFADTEAPAVAALCARAIGAGRVPVVLGLHTCSELISTLGSLEPDADATRLALFLAERMAAGEADAHCSPSRYNAEWYQRFYGLARTPEVVRYPLLDLPADVDPPSRRCVLYLGRIEPRKGVETLLAAWPGVVRCRTGWRLRLVGSDTQTAGDGGSLRSALQRTLPDDVRSTIEFVDARPRAGVEAEIAGAAVVVVPSRWDNFPNTCMEAMAAGRPVVVGDVGGTREMIEGSAGGRAFRSGDVAALTGALLELLEEPLDALAARGIAARKRIAALCDPHRVSEARVEVYRAAIERAADRPRRAPRQARLAVWRLLREAGRRGHGALAGVPVPGADPRMGAHLVNTTDLEVQPRADATDTGTLRVSVGIDDPAAAITLPVTRSSCWSGFLGHFALPHDDALDVLAEALEVRASMPARVELVGGPAPCVLPALWLRTIWLEPDATIGLVWPRVDPPGADVAEALAARLCCGLVDDVACPDGERAWSSWGIAVGAQPPAGLEMFDLGLGLVDAWDLRVRWTLGGARADWLFRMKDALERCAERGLDRVALYGGGTHTRAMGPVLLDPPVEVACIIDDHMAGPGARLWGFPVVTREAALALGVQAVILSANTWEDRLWEASAPLREAGVEVIRLYGESR